MTAVLSLNVKNAVKVIEAGMARDLTTVGTATL
jgi:hypothetical protein